MLCVVHRDQLLRQKILSRTTHGQVCCKVCSHRTRAGSQAVSQSGNFNSFVLVSRLYSHVLSSWALTRSYHPTERTNARTKERPTKLANRPRVDSIKQTNDRSLLRRQRQRQRQRQQWKLRNYEHSWQQRCGRRTTMKMGGERTNDERTTNERRTNDERTTNKRTNERTNKRTNEQRTTNDDDDDGRRR